jgi:nucleotide-binding universal stress UspA family protein
MFRRIIVGYNGTPQGDDGVALGVRLAEATGAALILGYVYPQQPPWFSSTRPYQRALREEIHGAFDAASKLVPDSIHLQTLALGSGSPARGLHDLAQGEHGDLLVLGSTHRGPVGRVLVGTVAEVLLTGAPCAVAIAPHGYRERPSEPIATVGAAFDGSPEGEIVLDHADRLAGTLQSSLRAIAAAEPPWLGYDVSPHPLEGRLAEAVEHVDRSPDTETLLLKGEPAKALAEAGDDVDLLVVGSRGYGPMRHVLLGSVSARLMRTCPCPLIVVPRGTPSPKPETEAVAAGSGSGVG